MCFGITILFYELKCIFMSNFDETLRYSVCSTTVFKFPNWCVGQPFGRSLSHAKILSDHPYTLLSCRYLPLDRYRFFWYVNGKLGL